MTVFSLCFDVFPGEKRINANNKLNIFSQEQNWQPGSHRCLQPRAELTLSSSRRKPDEQTSPEGLQTSFPTRGFKVPLFNGLERKYIRIFYNTQKYTYGSVSAGREKRPFNVLFFLKVEPPCDQTWWDSLVFSIPSCFSYVSHAENTLVGPVGPF